ncbi:MAG: YcaO-like family protein [Gammaproteobacteria bacterium]|nr:YcaO-like family protein [Gammaproteobacteria bacterium]MDE0367499.1 YcaO-like family protein [Gammaproteobacteria bacterium]
MTAGLEDPNLLALLDRVYDPEIGLIQSIVEVPLQTTDAELYIFVAEFQNPFSRPGVERSERQAVTQGSGAGLNRIDALWSTIGECLERYAAHVCESDGLLIASGRNLADKDRLSPERLIFFTDDQYSAPDFSFVRYDDSLESGWVPAKNLTTGSNALVPASFTYLGYEGRPHEQHDAGYSTGCAAGKSVDHALLSGLLEVIERDSFSVHWNLRRSPPEINLANHTDRLPATMLHLLASAPVKLRFFDITTDLGVPSVLAAGYLAEGRGLAIGASTRLFLSDAIIEAAVEAFHTANWIFDMRRRGDVVPSRQELGEFRDHVLYYTHPENSEAASFLFEGNEQRVPAAVFDRDGSPLEQLIEHLRTRNRHCYAADIAPTEFRDLNVPVMRTFINDVQPLSCGSGRQHLDTRRLIEFSDALKQPFRGYINDRPHPFP